MSGNIETPKIDRNKKILEDLGAVIYDNTIVLEIFENDLKEPKKTHQKE